MLYFKDILLSAVHIQGLNNSRVDLSLRHFNDRIEVSPSCRFCVAYSLTYWVFLIPRGPVHARRDNIPCSLMITPLWPSQSWYPTMLGMWITFLILLPRWLNQLLRRHKKSITSTTRSTPVRLLDCIREQFNGQEISPWCTDVISQSWSTGTEKQCNLARRALCSCYSLKSPDIF